MAKNLPLSSSFASFSNEFLGPLKNQKTYKRQFFNSRSPTMPFKATDPSNSRTWLMYISTRNLRRYLVIFALLTSIGLLWTRDIVTMPVKTLREKFMSPALPPLYESWYDLESHLPQQNLSLPYPEGESARFFFAENHVWGLGFNNALQEQLLLAHLAYISNRTFVFDAYTWNPNKAEQYSEYNGKLIPSRIPFSAFISGPNAGGSWPAGVYASRSVSRAYYDSICPSPFKVKSDALEARLGTQGTSDVAVVMDAWSAKLKQSPIKCMSMADSDQLFNWIVFGGGKVMMPFLDEYLKSPILQGFAWSSLIDQAVKANSHILTGASDWLTWLTGSSPTLEPRTISANDKSAIPGLLSIHVRRGDYDYHCLERAKWASTYVGWLMNPRLPDQFDVPPQEEYVQTDEWTKAYLSHCWPTPDEIVAKIAEVRRTAEGKDLNRVYVMTNAPIEWVTQLKKRITQTGGWDSVSSSRDLKLNAEQKYIAQAVDMAIAMRSQVFIGNGFSSLSANVIMMRLARHFSYLSNRLW